MAALLVLCRQARRGRAAPCLLASLCCIACWVTTHAAGASTLSDRKLGMLMTALQTDSVVTHSGDMGVQHFEFVNLTLATLPTTAGRATNIPSHVTVTLHMFAKYWHYGGNATIKGFLVADSRDLPKKEEGVRMDAAFQLHTATTPASEVTSFRVLCYAFSHWDPPRQAAMVYGFEHTFPLPEGLTAHEFLLSLTMAPAQVQAWKPGKAQNCISGMGLEQPPVSPEPNPNREVFVVLKPLYNFSPSVYSALIDRHIDFYQQLGVSKHLLYMRRENIPSLILGNRRIGSLIQGGKLIVIEWDGIPEHEVWHRQFDQRVIHSHAMLAFTGLDVYLMNIDLDEYLVTSRPELQDKSIQQIIEACAGGADAMDVRVQRHHTVCKQCDRTKPESNLWADYYLPTHPLTWYHLINYREVPRRRSIVNPNFMRAFYIHYGSLVPPYTSKYPDDKCMLFLHLPNMVRVREEADVVQANYLEDHSWMGMLSRFKPLEPPSAPKLAGGAKKAGMAARPAKRQVKRQRHRRQRVHRQLLTRGQAAVLASTARRAPYAMDMQAGSGPKAAAPQ